MKYSAKNILVNWSLGFILIALLSPTISLACKRPVGWKSPPSLTLEAAFAQADAVFEGRFKSGTSIDKTWDWETTFEKVETFKGPNGSEIRTITTHSTCEPYLFWDRPMDEKKNYVAHANEPANLIFYDQAKKQFLNVKLDSNSKDALKKMRQGATH